MTNLVPEWRVGDLILTDAPLAVPFGSVDYGKPAVVRQIIETVLSDGDYDLVTRTGNRVVSLQVVVQESDFAAHADVEALLQAECDKPFNEVYCDPGDGYGEPFVFDVFQGELEFTRDDDWERNGFRLYTLTFPARPFPRSVDAVAEAPTGTGVGTDRQKLYEITVAGSARTRPDLHVGSDDALGEVLIYSRPGGGGFIPLRQHRVDGATPTVSAITVSGAFEDITADTFEAEAPKADVVDGTYILVAFVGAGGGTKTITGTVVTQTIGYDLHTPVTLTATAALAAAGTVVQIGPPFQVPGAVVIDDSASVVRVTLHTNSGATALLDEAWLVEVGSGALTWVDSAPTSSGMIDAMHFWVEQPTIERPYRRVVKGALPNQVLAFGASPVRWGDHEFAPGVNGLALVTTDTDEADLDVTYNPRWFTHAGTV